MNRIAYFNMRRKTSLVCRTEQTNYK